MAVYFLKGNYGPIAFNADMTAAAPAPTEEYWYIERWSVWMGMQRQFGFNKFATSGATLTDGPWIDKLQATTTDADTSTATLEEDDDTDSPYKGDLRIKFTMS